MSLITPGASVEARVSAGGSVRAAARPGSGRMPTDEPFDVTKIDFSQFHLFADPDSRDDEEQAR